MPDRLPSLIVLVGFWALPALAGWVAAGWRQRRPSARAVLAYGTAVLVVVAYAGGWYCFNLHRMPPYIPGATMDPTYASPEAAENLARFTAALILPGSALAYGLAFRRLRRHPDGPAALGAGR